MGSPCAACKFVRRKCREECVFAPHFPPNKPKKFAYVNKVFGASNVAKIVNDLPFRDRNDAVESLAFEAESRLRDPVYGCVGLVSLLQHRLNEVQSDVHNAKEELSSYIGPHAMLPILQPPDFLSLPPQPQSSSSAQQQIFEAQQLAAADAFAREQQKEMLRAYGEGSNSQQHLLNQPQVDDVMQFGSVPDGSVTLTGFNQLNSGGSTETGMWPSLALGGNFVDSPSTNNNYDTAQLPAQLFIPTQSSVPAGSVTVTGLNQLNSGGTTETGMWPSLTLGSNFVDSPSTNDNVLGFDFVSFSLHAL